jgi:Transcriptional regulator PadR-like family
MDDIERLSRGYWRPSPGSVYPLLEEMTHEGVIRKGADGRYALTAPAAERHWGPGRFGPRSVDEATAELRGLVAYLEDLKTSHAEEFAKAVASMREARDRLSKVVG